jgi:hypothetical protein
VEWCGPEPGLVPGDNTVHVFCPHSSWGLGLDGQGVADPERTEMNSAEGWHLKKRAYQAPSRAIQSHSRRSCRKQQVEEVTKRVAVRARVLVEGVLDPNFTALSDHEAIRVQGMYTELVPFIEERGLVPARGRWEIVLLLTSKMPNWDAARVRYGRNKIDVSLHHSEKRPV